MHACGGALVPVRAEEGVARHQRAEEGDGADDGGEHGVGEEDGEQEEEWVSHPRKGTQALPKKEKAKAGLKRSPIERPVQEVTLPDALPTLVFLES